MLNKIKIENFKCFEKIEINLNNLNIFAGINGMGKSTIIQSILLMQQFFEQEYLKNKKICLNGNYVSLGTGGDILFEGAKEEIIKINIFENSVDNKYNALYIFHHGNAVTLSIKILNQKYLRNRRKLSINIKKNILMNLKVKKY